MFGMIKQKMKYLQFLLGLGTGKGTSESQDQQLSSDLETNLSSIRSELSNSSDLVVRQFLLGTDGKLEGAIIYLDGLIDTMRINETILKPLMQEVRNLKEGKGLTPKNAMHLLQSHIPNNDLRLLTEYSQVLDSILTGATVLLIDGSKEVLSLSTRGWQMRQIGEPDTESVVRGPREGFIETLRVNTALIRRRIRNPNLTIENFKVGKRTKTEVSVIYLKGVVNPKLVEEVRRRIKRIETDSMLDSGFLEEFIEDAPFSIFPTIGNTERPDKAAAEILEGRVAIIVDGTPMVLIVPYLFLESFQSAEDYYARPYYSTVVRWLRYISFGVSISLPALYVALTTYHQELVPTALLITAAASREGTPFPAMVEAIGMGMVFEILREAGIRMPRPVGQAVSIVGALVLGDAAVSAGLIGAPMVIVVALTAIASFLVPPQIDSGFFLRAVLTVSAAVAGAYGIILGLLAILIHLASLRSFGVPYLSPIAPLSKGDLKDVAARAPMWDMFARPRTIGWKDPQRQEFRLMPSPPQQGEGRDKP